MNKTAALLLAGLATVTLIYCDKAHPDQFRYNQYGPGNGFSITQGQVQRQNNGYNWNYNTFGSNGYSITQGRINRNGNFNGYSVGTEGVTIFNGVAPVMPSGPSMRQQLMYDSFHHGE